MVASERASELAGAVVLSCGADTCAHSVCCLFFATRELVRGRVIGRRRGELGGRSSDAELFT